MENIMTYIPNNPASYQVARQNVLASMANKDSLTKLEERCANASLAIQKSISNNP